MDVFSMLAELSKETPDLQLPKLVAEPPKVRHPSKYAITAPAMVQSLVTDGKTRITAENGVFYTNSKVVADQIIGIGGTLL